MWWLCGFAVSRSVVVGKDIAEMSIKHAFHQVRHYTLMKNFKMCAVNAGILFICLYIHLLRGPARKTFLGAFPKLRRATVSFIMSVRPSVCLSVRIEQISSHWTECDEIWYLSIFSKTCMEKSSFVKICQEWRVL